MKNIATILAAVALIAAAALGYLYYDTNNVLTETTNQLSASKKAEAATSAQLETANENIQALNNDLEEERSSLASTRTQLNDTSNKLAMQKRESNNLSKQLTQAGQTAKKLEDQNSSLSRQLAAMRRQVTELEGSKEKVEKLEQQILALQEANAQMQQDFMLAQAKAIPTGGPVETEESTSSSYNFNNRPAVQPATLGPEVTIVTTRTSDGMLVLQAPAEAGIEAGTEITLVKNFKALAKISIFESNEGDLLANILPEPKPASLKDGTVVQFLR
ncbi:MAG: hypothetical protein ACON39_00425 [Coraliomargaritaceae bacterium]